MPRQKTFTSGFPAYVSWVNSSPPTVGTPTAFPYPAIPATTPPARKRLFTSVSGPKRSGSRSAIGRAPIVKMSRMMPPTPVAAPWRGSMNEGWLWLSILKTMARPSPMSTTPAFSPGPCRMHGPWVGSVLRWTRELL